MGVDGFSVWLVVLTAFMTPVAIVSSWGVSHRVRLFMALTLLLETAIVGSFLALDLLLFFVFFEALLVPMFLVIGMWGSSRRVYASLKFFLYTMAGSAFLLLGIVYLWFQTSQQLAHASFDIRQMERLSLATTTQRWLFLAFFVAFAVKVPIFPLHTWLPDAHTEAPTNGSIVLAALLLKAGPYGLLRFNLDLFPEASRYFADAIDILAVVGIVYGAVVAMMQTDVKRLVAYSSVSHMGFVILGIFTFTMQGTSGAVMQMVNHGLSTGLLFFVIGVLYERTHTRDLSEMGGLAAVTPWIAAAFLVATLSSIGLPGLNNFVGEFLVILGSFGADRVLGAVAVTRRRPRRDLHALGLPAGVPGSGGRTPPGAGRPAAARARGGRPRRRGDAGARRRSEPRPGPDQPVLGRGGGLGAERRRRPGRTPGRPAGEAPAAG